MKNNMEARKRLHLPSPEADGPMTGARPVGGPGPTLLALSRPPEASLGEAGSARHHFPPECSALHSAAACPPAPRPARPPNPCCWHARARCAAASLAAAWRASTSSGPSTWPSLRPKRQVNMVWGPRPCWPVKEVRAAHCDAGFCTGAVIQAAFHREKHVQTKGRLCSLRIRLGILLHSTQLCSKGSIEQPQLPGREPGRPRDRDGSGV